MLVSRLRGLSKFQPSNVMLGLSTQELDIIIDTVNCLQLVAHQVLIISGSELRQFMAFSSWLRQEIDVQASDTISVEGVDKEPDIDYASTLQYIEGAMMRSDLTKFFELEPQNSQNLQWELELEGRSLFQLYRKDFGNSMGQEVSSKRLPRLDALIDHLDTQCTAVFSSIAETQRRNVRFGTPVSLGNGISTSMDLRMILEVRSENSICGILANLDVR